MSASRSDNPVPSAPAGEPDRDRNALRVRNGVRLVVSDEEGFPAERLPDGVYGFSFSPATEGLPLFARHGLQSFEVHRVTGGGIQILGYLTPSEAAKLETEGGVLLRLYPAPYQQATQLVAIPGDRLGAIKGPSRSEGNYLTVTVG